MIHSIKKFIKDKSGATAIEYGLIASLIAVAIMASVQGLGGSLKDKFEKIHTELDKKPTTTNT
ncbi:MAG: Flp family type IVb pilin [Candidatus Liberibacter europaeus]|uniref:Flp family type IVb pilin n=1 Tax=Candidatus Liberibacter europaeus TaxID=744859 RepID=A0A2T4VZ81_9HYPH|nr:Flp family type IVb pilin [Candidatus Liberibacter europaeus]PTL87068.1 MAG: Flp family type IVb pilin [Candidatus Liberibacter europaeus]